MKQKKGALTFSITLVIMVVAILLYAWAQLTHKYSQFDEKIGEKQYDLINIYQKAESALFYIDQSSKYALQQSIYDLAKNGGISEIYEIGADEGFVKYDCGTFLGANSWAVIEFEKNNVKIRKCYSSNEDVKNNLKKIFDLELNEYLANYPDAYIPGSYEYELSDSLEVIGKATEKLAIDILPEGFVFKPKEILTTDTRGIYNLAITREIPQKLTVPMKSKPDVETIKQYHPEVWNQYAELCKRMGYADASGNPPGLCKSSFKKCCITSGYRHWAYNAEIGGARDSPHQYGVALDIYVGKSLNEQLKWARTASQLFTRIGIYPADAHIHVDLMPPKERFAATYWIGDGGKTLASASSIEQLESEASRFA